MRADGIEEGNTGFWWGNRRKKPLGGLRIKIKWKFRKWDMRARTELIWLRIGTGGGLLWCGNEPLGSINCGEFLDWMSVSFLEKTVLNYGIK